jgi:predicted Zn-dependent protease
LLKNLLAEGPKDPNVKSYAAMLEIGRKRWAQAIPLYKEVIALQPNNALALNNLAWALYETKDPEAMAIAEKAYALAPKSPEVLDTFGTILLAKGDAARATDILKMAVSGAPKVMGYRVRLAEALIARGDKTSAKKELEFVLGEVKSGPAMEQAQALMKTL